MRPTDSTASSPRMPSIVALWALLVACWALPSPALGGSCPALAGSIRADSWTAATRWMVRLEAGASVQRAERLDDDFAGSAWTVQFDQEDALPLTQQELAVGDGDAFARAEHQLQTVRVTVGALVIVHVHRTHTEVVVPIVRIGGRVALQELTQIFEQQRF